MQVQLNTNYKHNPQFGMAFRKNNISKFAQYTGIDKNPVVERGFNQFEKWMGKLKHYDVEFMDDKTVRIIENASNETCEIFYETVGETGLKHYRAKKYLGREFFARIFNPKRFLPYNLLIAGKRAEILERSVVRKKEMAELIEKYK